MAHMAINVLVKVTATVRDEEGTEYTETVTVRSDDTQAVSRYRDDVWDRLQDEVSDAPDSVWIDLLAEEGYTVSKLQKIEVDSYDTEEVYEERD